MKRIASIEELNKEKHILCKWDTNVTGKRNGYVVFYQNEKYFIGTQKNVDELRNDGWLVFDQPLYRKNQNE